MTHRAKRSADRAVPAGSVQTLTRAQRPSHAEKRQHCEQGARPRRTRKRPSESHTTRNATHPQTPKHTLAGTEGQRQGHYRRSRKQHRPHYWERHQPDQGGRAGNKYGRVRPSAKWQRTFHDGFHMYVMVAYVCMTCTQLRPDSTLLQPSPACWSRALDLPPPRYADPHKPVARLKTTHLFANVQWSHGS